MISDFLLEYVVSIIDWKVILL